MDAALLSQTQQQSEYSSKAGKLSRIYHHVLSPQVVNVQQSKQEPESFKKAEQFKSNFRVKNIFNSPRK